MSVAFRSTKVRLFTQRKATFCDSYSLADISAMVVVDFADWIKLSLPEDAQHTRRWYESVSSRPSAAA